MKDLGKTHSLAVGVEHLTSVRALMRTMETEVRARGGGE